MHFKHFVSVVLFIFVTSLSLSQTTIAQTSAATKSTTENQDDPLPLEDLRLFTVIFDHIRRSYVEPVSDQELLENAIKGMLQELDPHSDYLDTSHFNSLQETTKGEFSGVGIEIGNDKGYIKIITPIDGSPAEEAGLQAGDLIIELDNKSIRGLSISEAAKRMRGPKGTPVIFTVIRAGEEKSIDITVIRNIIKTRSVRSRIVEDNFGYIRISQFQSSTGTDFVDSIKKLRKKNPQLQGLVIDLRNNPGGVLQASVQVVDALIDDGLIVYTEGRLENNNQSFSAQPGDVSEGLPIAVLINGGSASAAEIVAGALQDHERAIIMGTQSFGKGSVQTILPVGKDKGIKLTTARYYTPKGRSIQATGIVPDVVIQRAQITQLYDDNRRVKEADLEGHISNDSDNTTVILGADRDTSDNQLFEAINLLKGIAIFNKTAKK